MTFNDMLKQALQETVDERVERMLNVSPKPRFSLSYRLWEYRTLKNFRQNRFDSSWTLRKARRVVTTVMITAVLALTLTACAAVGMTIGRFSFNDKRDYSELFMASLSSDKTSLEEYYGLPEEDGWQLVDYSRAEMQTLLIYRCGEKRVTFCQDVVRGDMGNINTKNTVVEPMSLYEEKDSFFIALQSGDCALCWIYDGYLFSLNGNLDKKELTNLALSTKIVEF